jgi:hypothetical protein
MILRDKKVVVSLLLRFRAPLQQKLKIFQVDGRPWLSDEAFGSQPSLL